MTNPEGNQDLPDVSKPLPLGGPPGQILSVVSLKTFSKYGYTYLKEIVLRRANYQDYKISEADFKNMHQNDFEDMYLLHLQGKLNHLSRADKVTLFNAVNVWIRNIIIRHCVEDLQLGVESSQTKLNLTQLRWDAFNFLFKEDYTIVHKLSQNQGDLPMDNLQVSVEVLRYDIKQSKSENKGIVPTEMELVLEQTQQGTSHEVSEDASNQGRNDQYKGISIVQEDAETLGRHGQDTEVNTDSIPITTAIIYIATAEPISIVIAPITNAGVSVSTAKPKSFVPINLEVVEGSSQVERSKKRTRKELDEASVKRQKLEDDAEKAELKLYLEIIIRANGRTKYYNIFCAMLDDFDRQDVLDLYRLVKERFETTNLEGYDRFLWGDLITLFEPSLEDEIWKAQPD
nr:hypothetical protein [Tanacetum cinerariifolium]